MLPKTRIPRVIPHYYSGVSGDSAGYYSLSVFPRKFPRQSKGICREIQPAEFIMWYEAVGEKDRCHNDLIVCLVL